MIRRIFALLDAAGQPTSLFTNTAQINSEVANIGDTLKLLTSTQVRFVTGSGSTLPTGTTAWTSQSGGSYIIDRCNQNRQYARALAR